MTTPNSMAPNSMTPNSTTRPGHRLIARLPGALWLGLMLVLWAAPDGLAASKPVNQGSAGKAAVDLELVLAVDISRSMDPEEQLLQLAGYVAAFRDPDVIGAIQGGPIGRIAVSYFEWAGTGLVRELLPWRLVDGPESAEAVAQALAATTPARMRRTSISGGLRHALDLFERSPFTAPRRVIDISGDGPNNQGEPVTEARDAVLERGIVINGLPVMLRQAYPGFFDIQNLDLYYEDCVIGGFGAFAIPVREPSEFAAAIRRKLVLEIAGRMPEPRPIPAQYSPAQYSGRESSPLSPSNCLIGEQLWGDMIESIE